MPEPNSGAIANIGDLAKPIDSLVNHIYDALKVWIDPRRVRRMAEAKAYESAVEVSTRLQLTELQQRSLHRMIEEETRHQINMENILEMAKTKFDEKADVKKINSDWIESFFNCCRHIQNEDVQQIWAKLLAEQINSTGLMSKAIIPKLMEIELDEIEVFRKLVGCSISYKGTYRTYIHNLHSKFLIESGISIADLKSLETARLITIDSEARFLELQSPGRIEYFGISKLLLEHGASNATTKINIGIVHLTRIGNDLFKLVGIDKNDHFEKMLIGHGFKL